jgi:hypothetical protein
MKIIRSDKIIIIFCEGRQTILCINPQYDEEWKLTGKYIFEIDGQIMMEYMK